MYGVFSITNSPYMNQPNVGISIYHTWMVWVVGNMSLLFGGYLIVQKHARENPPLGFFVAFGGPWR